MLRSSPKLELLMAAACIFLLIAHAQQKLQQDDHNVTERCKPHERDALLAFKAGITDDYYGRLDSWRRGHDCCNWTFVTCSSESGHVTKLLLSSIPWDVTISGHINPSLNSLEFLEYLDLTMMYLDKPDQTALEFLGPMRNLRRLNLSGMDFSGAVPPLLGNLTNLEYLDLSSASFIGGMPPQLGNLSNLQYLDLSYMKNVYSADISWLSHLQHLEYLNMSGMNLSMVADWPHVLNRIPSIMVVILEACYLPSTNQFLAHLNFTTLHKLDLSRNHFHHPVASSWFWNSTSIEHLLLSETYLYGPFPEALGRMTNLQVLNFTSNGNSATMAVDMEELCALHSLWLDKSLSSGNIAEFVGNLPRCSSNKLYDLHLMGNNMTGFLPGSLRHLTSLVNLDLSNNHLTGHIPSAIGICQNLSDLNLSHNNLDGVITEEHLSTTLKRLLRIDLSHNLLKILVNSEWLPPFRLEEGRFACCRMGPCFPSWLKSQEGISLLDISNTGIVELPEWFVYTFSGANYLDFSHNQISGVLPSNLTAMVALHELYINSNQVTGQIPLLPARLHKLDMSQNSLSGPLPLQLGSGAITELILYSNNITGHIPEYICDLVLLLVLDLSNNSIDGEYPQCLTVPISIGFLLLNNNALSGNFPSLQNSKNLAFLDLSWNKFSGALPLWIGSLPSLRFLQLSHNMFHGEIPETITNLKRLHYLNLAGNTLSGAIPSSLLRLTAMTQKRPKKHGFDMYVWYSGILGKFKDVLSVVLKRQELKYSVGILKMVSIDLSFNQLTGGIPDDITSLNGLVNLNLSWNHLVGQIPKKIGDMKSLESLDLSRNNFSGEVPPSLSDITYLSYLDLSYNNLTGRIPQGRQLDTLYTENPSMYDGNSGLCGLPLPKNCSRSSLPAGNGTQKISEKDADQPMSFYSGVGCGFTFGLWIVFCVMLFSKKMEKCLLPPL